MTFISSIISGVTSIYNMSTAPCDSCDSCVVNRSNQETQNNEFKVDEEIESSYEFVNCDEKKAFLSSATKPLLEVVPLCSLTRSSRCYDLSEKIILNNSQKTQESKNQVDMPENEKVSTPMPIKFAKPCHIYDNFFVLDKGILQIIKKIGQGTFGNVYEAFYMSQESKRMEFIAIKVSKLLKDGSVAKESFESLLEEAEFLKEFSVVDPDDIYPTIKMISSGLLNEKLYYIAQPLCEMSLHDYIYHKSIKEIVLPNVKKITRQIFQALSHISSFPLRLVHLDLKPANILVQSLDPIRIRLADFGSSAKGYQLNIESDYAVTRYYRPPEIVFNLPYDHTVDVWSASCVAIELMCRSTFFPAQSEKTLIPMFIQFLGPVPISIKDLESKVECPLELTERGYIYSSHAPLDPVEHRRQYFEKVLETKKDRIATSGFSRDSYKLIQDVDLFREFIKKSMNWLSFNRISATEALRDPYLANDLVP